jgi:acetyl-CoA carboxylase carboxyltransferase component
MSARFHGAVRAPLELRKRLVECLRRLRNKKDEGPRRKHGNIPL